MDTKLTCSFCPDKFNNITELVFHFSKIHKITKSLKYYPCNTNNCDKVYKKLENFKKHVIKVHNLTNSNELNALSSTNEVSEIWRPAGIDLEAEVANEITRLRLNNNITGTALGDVVTSFENILKNSISKVQCKVKEYLDFINIDTSNADLKVDAFLNQFTFNDSYAKYKDMRGQINLLQNNYNYISHEARFLGKDQDEFMYVPLKKTLELILSNDEVMNFIEHQTNKSNDDLLRCYEDGRHYKNHKFFQKFPNALRLQFYYDEFVTNNALSNKVHEQKIGAFYFSILNLPEHLRRFSGNVHVLAFFKHHLLDKYELNDFLRPFVTELKELEKDSGVSTFIKNKPYTLRASLATVTGDTAAINPLLGFLGPGANLFCRVCMVSRNEFQNRRFFSAERRTKELLQEQLKEILLDSSATTRTGVAGPCELNKLNYFHSCNNQLFDLLHDLFEGWVQYVIKLTVAYFVLDKQVIDVETLNYRINIFSCGPTEKSNKPNPKFTLAGLKNVEKDHKIKQKGAQTWCLLRMLPFIFYDLVEPDDIYLQYLLDLNRITEIAMSPVISKSTLPVLRSLLRSHYNNFNILYPTANKINKLDHIMHLPESIEQYGPMINYACFIYEDKHQVFQDYANISNNYINLPVSLMNISQINQCSIWGLNSNPLRKKIDFNKSKKICVKDTGIAYLFEKCNFKDDDEVECTNKINIYSTKYKVDWFLVIEIDEETKMPTLGQINDIYVYEEDVYFYCKKWYSQYLQENLNAYNVVRSANECLVNIKNLCDSKPYSLWQTYAHDCLHYVSLRHILY